VFHLFIVLSLGYTIHFEIIDKKFYVVDFFYKEVNIFVNSRMTNALDLLCFASIFIFQMTHNFLNIFLVAFKVYFIDLQLLITFKSDELQ